MSVHVFQIGCSGFGKYGFEKFVDKERFFPEDVVFEAVCEKDFEHSESAELFAEAADNNVVFVDSVDKLYDLAGSVDGTVLIYDAGPVNRHADHIRRSLSNDYYHLAEKPPSTTREEHIEERKLASKHNVHYKVDFIERENPVVKKAAEILEDVEIDSLKVFRQSSRGVQRILQPVRQAHVNEGCTLDKMIHDIYVSDLVDVSDLKVESVDNIVFMPRKVGGEKLLRIDGGTTESISSENSLGRVTSEISSEKTGFEFHASWLGVTDEAKIYSRKVGEIFGEKLIDSKYAEIGDESFLDQEARFFVAEGRRNIVGDLLNFKLYDLDHEKEVNVESYPRDQLYRVLERAVVDAAGESVDKPEEEILDSFMSALFDVQDLAAEKSIDVFTALDDASSLIKSMIVTDKTNLDKDDLKGVAS